MKLKLNFNYIKAKFFFAKRLFYSSNALIINKKFLESVYSILQFIRGKFAIIARKKTLQSEMISYFCRNHI